MATSIETTRRDVQVAGKWPALMLAIVVHVVFIAVLILSVRWQNRRPEPVTAELYAPPTRTVEAPRPVPPPPKPEPKAEPEPPKIAKPIPPPPVEKPDTRAADIALKAKQDEERRRRELAEIEQREAAQREAERRELERKRQEEQKRLAEARERQTREAEALKAQALREAQMRETQTRVQQQAEREAQLREQERLAQERAAQSAAFGRAEQDYIRRIQAKVRGNVIEPGELVGNPEAVFEVVQLPTGDIIDVRLKRSSGFRAYDDAVERAIRKSSPLPRPAQPEIWQRVLELRVRPRD